MATLAEKGEALRQQLGIAPGTPLHEIVSKAENDLGLTAGKRNLGERIDQCCNTLGVSGGELRSDIGAAETEVVVMGQVILGQPVSPVVPTITAPVQPMMPAVATPVQTMAAPQPAHMQGFAEPPNNAAPFHPEGAPPSQLTFPLLGSRRAHPPHHPFTSYQATTTSGATTSRPTRGARASTRLA